MIFNSLQYAVFFAIVLAIYWRLAHRPQVVLLLVASYIFYGAWNWRFLGLMLLTTVVDYSVGRALAATPDERRRKLLFGAMQTCPGCATVTVAARPGRNKWAQKQ